MIEKTELRAKMRSLRGACTDRDKRDKALFARVTASELYQNADCILCYVSVGSEADTSAPISKALADGKAMFVPRCVPNTNRMEFYRITSLDDLTPGAYGIPEPPAKEENRYDGQTPAVCFVPGLAFTKGGLRIGYGKGYYDTFLEKANVYTVGLCYDFQLVDRIPTECHDRQMDCIITDKALYEERKAD